MFYKANFKNILYKNVRLFSLNNLFKLVITNLVKIM